MYLGPSIRKMCRVTVMCLHIIIIIALIEGCSDNSSHNKMIFKKINPDNVDYIYLNNNSIFQDSIIAIIFMEKRSNAIIEDICFIDINNNKILKNEYISELRKLDRFYFDYTSINWSPSRPIFSLVGIEDINDKNKDVLLIINFHQGLIYKINKYKNYRNTKWSPNGNYLAFCTSIEKNNMLVILNINEGRYDILKGNLDNYAYEWINNNKVLFCNNNAIKSITIDGKNQNFIAYYEENILTGNDNLSFLKDYSTKKIYANVIKTNINEDKLIFSTELYKIDELKKCLVYVDSLNTFYPESIILNDHWILSLPDKDFYNLYKYNINTKYRSKLTTGDYIDNKPIPISTSDNINKIIYVRNKYSISELDLENKIIECIYKLPKQYKSYTKYLKGEDG